MHKPQQGAGCVQRMNAIMCGAESDRRPAEEGQQAWDFELRLSWRNRKSDYNRLGLRHRNHNSRHVGRHLRQLTDRAGGRIVVFLSRLGIS